MKLKSIVATAVVASASVAVSLCATSAFAADSFSVFTGYADSLRPSGFFPTPWLGDAGVVSESAASQSGGFDSGAIRILNTGASSIVITNFTVTLNGGGTVYNFWNPLTIGAGQNGIFTQTFAYNFDSSDNSTGSPPGGISGGDPGSNGIGGCSSTPAAQAAASITAYCAGRAPVITFDENGNPESFTDTGHIIDTGNYDFINGSTDGNESIKWNLVGSPSSRGGSGGIPEPATWAMMIVGVGMVGLASRRRRQGMSFAL